MALVKKTSKGKKNLQLKSKKPTKKPTGKKPGRKAKVKEVVGHSILKRDVNSLVKAFGKIDKASDEFATKLNSLCYDEENNKDVLLKETNATLLVFGKAITEFKALMKKAKAGIKPIYS